VLRRGGWSARPKAEKADPGALRAVATRHLARRDFASAELAARLESRGFEAAAVATLIAELAAERLLDDARFGEQFVLAHARRGQGPVRIRQELRTRGLSEESIQVALESAPDWVEVARRVRGSKFGTAPPADGAEHARQARFLQYRGFSTDHIRAALGRDPDPPHSDPR
jgi:regulatory protein